MADKNVSSDLKTSADILAKLRRIQNKGDKQDEKRIDLELEQKKLVDQAHKAKIIISKAGDIISFEEFQKLMK